MTERFQSAVGGAQETVRHGGGSCRVCREIIRVDEPALLRPWCFELSHVRCGYLRPEERKPNEFRYPERWGTYWQWACPCCARDMVTMDRPAELRCRHCIAEGKGSAPAPTRSRKPVTFEIPEGTDVSACKSCGELIAFVLTPRGKRMPVETRTHESHFARCPKAKDFRKPNTRIATK